MAPASLLRASMAIPGVVIKKGEGEGLVHVVATCHISKLGLIQSFLTVGLKQGLLLPQRGHATGTVSKWPLYAVSCSDARSQQQALVW